MRNAATTFTFAALIALLGATGAAAQDGCTDGPVVPREDYASRLPVAPPSSSSGGAGAA
ncbi:hypothetical protein [Kineococcus indalonis]|uniref:hypothetical protein n=1 Tax=Kineococcus indalonis TaxID=2696566 RepID=UPI001412A5E8|nr:hypothetical protein [Kineococcus indalonis]NAZ88322.1 hypothetical protein [Kineococcus indalonis]